MGLKVPARKFEWELFMYIVIEGVDTSGKTTQIEILKEKFSEAIFTKEPGGSELGREIRKILLDGEVKSKNAELLLFLADRAEHYDSLIKPNIGKMIFSDRSFISGIAYAMANNQDINIDFLISLNLFVLENKLPDLVVLLKTNEKLIKSRMSEKNEDNIEKRGVDYLLWVQNCMENILRRLDIDYLLIDSSNSVEIISQKIDLEIKNRKK